MMFLARPGTPKGITHALSANAGRHRLVRPRTEMFCTSGKQTSPPRRWATPLIPASAARSLQVHPPRATNGAERLPSSGRYILEASHLEDETRKIHFVVQLR